MSDTQKVQHWRSDDEPEVFSEGPKGRAISSYIMEIGKWEVELYRHDSKGSNLAWQFETYEAAEKWVEEQLT